MQESLPSHDIVLLGMGHTNAHILRMWRMSRGVDCRLTCVSPFPVATYSGMLPGVLAGQYAQERMEIDLVRLCAAAGARLVLGHITGLDRDHKRVLFDDRAALAYDVLSIGVGSMPVAQTVNRTDPSIVLLKPMQLFQRRLHDRLDELLRTGVAPVHVIIVGAGAGGVEIAYGLPTRLRAMLGKVPFRLTLISATDRVIGGVSPKTSARALRELTAIGVEVLFGRQVTTVASGKVTLDDGLQLSADVVIWATSAVGLPILGRLGLPTDERGFLRTRATLQSVGDDSVFAVGDAGTIEQERVPKAGVYAVRQGPVLWRNLQHYLRGEPLEEYSPQRHFLKLFNTGDGRAIGEYFGITLAGRWAWRLKDWIDSRFMQKFQDYDKMDGEPLAAAGGPVVTGSSKHPAAGHPRESLRGRPRRMRCAGCGGKVAGSILSRVLQRLDVPASEHVLVGLDEPDDAAVIAVPAGSAVNFTVDFFAAPLDDPYLVGRIAALNSASDCFATGAKPLAALASVTLPVGPPSKQEQLLYELLAGALHEFRPMGATLAGGHTIEGSPLTIGFSMVAAQFGPPRTKRGLRPGDQLVLTKPLGIGVLLAAHMEAKCRAAWWETLLHTMLLSNQHSASVCDEFDIQGLTDVTGFGLAGHLLEMLRPSGLAAELDLAQIPLLPGSEELLRAGWESTLAPANRSVESELEAPPASRETARYNALFDPQTSGGLLLGVPARHVAGFLARLAQQSEVPAAVIGRVVEQGAGERRLRVVG